MPKTRILVVEDKKLVSEGVKNDLEVLGYVVSGVVSSGDTVIRKAEEYKPDLVLMDVVLQGRTDCVDTAVRIFKRFNIPVVFLTTHADRLTLQEAEIPEYFEYVVRPCDEKDLYLKVEMAIYKHKMEKKLRESEDRYRTLSCTTMTIPWEFDVSEFRFTYVGTHAFGLLGYPINEWYKDNFWHDHIHPDDRDETIKWCMECTQRSEDHQLEYRMVRSDKDIVWIYDIVEVIDGDEGAKRLRGVMVDITERKRAEEELLYHLKFESLVTNISSDFINLAVDKIDQGVEAALQVVGEFANVDRSYIFQFSIDRSMMSNTHEWCAPGIDSQIKNLQDLPVGKFDWAITRIKKGEVLHVPRVSELPYEAQIEREEFVRQNIKSLIVVPLESMKEIVGFIGFDAVRYEKYWSNNMINLIRTMGIILVNVLNRKKIEKSLWESEDRYRDLFENVNDLIQCVTPEGRIAYVNNAWRDTLGYNEDEVVGLSLFDIIHPDSHAHCMEVFKRVISGEHVKDIDAVFVAKDGGKIYVEGSANCRFERGKPVSIRGIFRSITERRRTEEAFKKRTERVINYQNALLELSKHGFSYLESALKEITETVSKTMEVERVSVWFLNKEGSAIICKDLYKMSEDFHEKGMKLHSKDYPRYFETLKEHRIIAANDARNYPDTSEFTESYLKPYGITSMMDAPIRLHGKMVGIVCHEHTGPVREWMAEDQDFAASIADMVSLALVSLERRQAENKLNENYKNQEVLNKLLNISIEKISLIEQLEKSLDVVLAIPWMPTLPKGAIFIVENEPDVLVLKANRNLPVTLLEMCAHVPFGRCLCGRAALNSKTWYAGFVDEWHDNLYEGIVPHGHYIIPMILDRKIIGVLTLYLEEGHKRNEREIMFLETIAATLAVMVRHKHEEEYIRKLSQVIKQSPVTVVITDTNGIIEYANPKFVRLTGYSVEDAIGQNTSILKSEKTPSEVYKELWNTIKSGNVWRGEFCNRKKSGEFYWEYAVISPVKSPDGVITNFIAVKEDITSRKKMEEALLQSEKLKSMGMITSGVLLMSLITYLQSSQVIYRYWRKPIKIIKN